MSAAQQSAFCHKVQDTTLAIFVAGIPILYGRVFDFGTILHNNLNDGCMQLVFVTHRGGASFEITDISILIGDDESTLELPYALRIDAKVGAEFHGATYPFGNIDKGTIGKDGAVQRRKEIVTIGYDGTKIFPHQLRMLSHGLADGTEDDSLRRQLFAESSLHRNAVHDGIHGCAT